MTPRDQTIEILKRYFVEGRIDVDQLDYSVGYVLDEGWYPAKATQESLALHEKIDRLRAVKV